VKRVSDGNDVKSLLQSDTYLELPCGHTLHFRDLVFSLTHSFDHLFPLAKFWHIGVCFGKAVCVLVSSMLKLTVGFHAIRKKSTLQKKAKRNLSSIWDTLTRFWLIG